MLYILQLFSTCFRGQRSEKVVDEENLNKPNFDRRKKLKSMKKVSFHEDIVTMNNNMRSMSKTKLEVHHRSNSNSMFERDQDSSQITKPSSAEDDSAGGKRRKRKSIYYT